jgi:hypothetical protein
VELLSVDSQIIADVLRALPALADWNTANFQLRQSATLNLKQQTEEGQISWRCPISGSSLPRSLELTAIPSQGEPF